MSDKEAFYDNLKDRLEKTTIFPSDYLYKFIIPSSKNELEEVKRVFDEVGAIITTKKSKKGKYTGISVRLQVKNSEEIISYYRKVEKIEGILSL